MKANHNEKTGNIGKYVVVSEYQRYKNESKSQPNHQFQNQTFVVSEYQRYKNESKSQQYLLLMFIINVVSEYQRYKNESKSQHIYIN